MNPLQPLISLANALDSRGMFQEANQIDNIIKFAVEMPRITEWLRKKYEHLQQLYAKKQKNPSATKEYEAVATNRLDDMLRRKQSGPPDERIFLWFCQQFPNSCSACHDRHGRMRTLRQWRTEGLPGTAVCEKIKCSCHLVPLMPGGALPSGIQMDEDGNIAVGDLLAGAVGVREDGIGHNMNQGFILEPFFSNLGKVD